MYKLILCLYQLWLWLGLGRHITLTQARMKRMILVLLTVMSAAGLAISTNQYDSLGNAKTTRPWDDVANCLVISPKDNILTEYTRLASSVFDGKMGTLSATNRRTLILLPGIHTVPGGYYGLPLIQYVDIRGFGRHSSIIYGPASIAGSNRGAIYTPASLATAETGITNYLSNIGITGGSCAVSTQNTDNKAVYVFDNCYMYGLTDCYYMATTGTVSCDTYFYGCSFVSGFDCIAVQGLGQTLYIYNSSFKSVAATGGNPANTGYLARNVVMGNSTAYLYGCTLNALSDSSAIENASSTAYNLYTMTAKTSANIKAYNCTYSASATKHAGGTTQDCAAICCAAGAITVSGGQILSATNGEDLWQTAGSLTVKGLIYNESNTTGTIIYDTIDGMPQETVVADGALSIYGYSAIDQGASTLEMTLADGVFNGQTKYIYSVDSGAGENTVSIEHHITSDPEVYYFDAGEYLWLLWQNGKWYTLATTASIAAD